MSIDNNEIITLPGPEAHIAPGTGTLFGIVEQADAVVLLCNARHDISRTVIGHSINNQNLEAVFLVILPLQLFQSVGNEPSLVAHGHNHGDEGHVPAHPLLLTGCPSKACNDSYSSK
ncbi:hypothetical protein DSECCO2_557070 [anaerobic digester metagenome]